MSFDMQAVRRGLVNIWHQSGATYRTRRHPLRPRNRLRVEGDAYDLDQLYLFTNYAMQQMEINNDYIPHVTLGASSGGAEPAVCEVRNA